VTTTHRITNENARVRYSASQEAEALISTMGRTEDIKFSPDGSWLAIAAFTKNLIHLFRIGSGSDNAHCRIKIENPLTIQSDALLNPHGIDFLGEDKIIVANRAGRMTLFEIPNQSSSGSIIKQKPAAIFKGSKKAKIGSPGSVACLKLAHDRYRVFCCNNYLHTVTAHDIELGKRSKAREERTLIRRGLSIPDGICISPDHQWIAISNHSTGTVLLYRMDSALNPDTKPHHMLHGIVCPHGIRFSADDSTLYVIDSASPYLHIFKQQEGQWTTIQKPTNSICMLDTETFERGRYNAQEGGLKGMDILHTRGLLAVTSEHCPLAFYDMDTLMQTPAVNIEEEIRDKSLQRDFELI
jgi:WD40 repeat protein